MNLYERFSEEGIVSSLKGYISSISSFIVMLTSKQKYCDVHIFLSALEIRHIQKLYIGKDSNLKHKFMVFQLLQLIPYQIRGN